MDSHNDHAHVGSHQEEGEKEKGEEARGPGVYAYANEVDPKEADALNRARIAADLQVIRRGLDRIGPTLLACLYFLVMACLTLVSIRRRMG